MHKTKYMMISTILVLSLSLAGLSFVASARPLATAIAPGLGTAGSFAVLGGSAVTNTGSSVVNGDLGVWPSIAIIGFPPGSVVPPGTTYAGDAVAHQAQNDVTTAYNALAGQVCTVDLTGQDLGGLNLSPGVYCFSSSAQLTGPLTLNTQGDPNAVFVFQIGTTLTTASDSSVSIIGGSGCNVFWQIATSATLGTSTQFQGSILALASITLNTTADIVPGRALARNGAVTLHTNEISNAVCMAQATQTAVAATQTAVVAATQTAVVATQTAVVAATQTALAPTLTPTRTPTPTRTNTPTVTPTRTNTPKPATSTPKPAVLPGTGFAPQQVTILSSQPANKAYADLGDLWLEIPRLGVQMPIVGVPQQADGEWDVSWLGNQAGWLNGTAFPTWAGNSALTGHVYDANGKPGPFVHLNGLWWGDKVIVHAWGAEYVYAVRQVTQVAAGATSAVIKPEKLSWVTLITCRGYDEASDSYRYRVVVQAVLVKVH